MRDPDSHLIFEKEFVIREIASKSKSISFLHSDLVKNLIKSGKISEFDFVSEFVIKSPRLNFISYPFEWSDFHLFKAANLTLDISKELFRKNYELKDASAWNIIFEGCTPIFCDLTSFQNIESSQWRAFSQFIRHFSLPLALSKHKKIKSHQIFTLYRDGVPLDFARNTLGLKRYLTRYWPLLLKGKFIGSEKLYENMKPVRPLHHNLYNFCDLLIKPYKNSDTSFWSKYTHNRTHYEFNSLEIKKQKVKEWLSELLPKRTVDLGCNTGEFTEIASKFSNSVIAIDFDHDCIEQLAIKLDGTFKVYPVITNISEMIGGFGWAGKEFPSLLARLENNNDMLLMLGIIHHLAIAESISFNKIAKIAAKITTKNLIVEFLDCSDPMIVKLCRQYNRDPKDFDYENQIDSFNKHFNILNTQKIYGTSRTLCLMSKH